MRALLCLFLLFAACPTSPEPDPTPEGPPPEPVEATFRALDAFGAALEAEVRVLEGAIGDDEAETDDAGRVDLVLTAESAYRVRFSADGYAPHEVVGVAGDDDFTFATLMGSRAAEGSVYGLLGLQPDPERGTLVVDLHASDRVSAAIGASAGVDVEHDPAFIFVGNRPESGATLVPGANTFVTFPNVEPGEVDVTTEGPADGACLVGSAEDPELDRTVWEVPADTVVVVDFICP